jgi:glycosyltransferase involved in cell wall biosynthesis
MPFSTRTAGKSERGRPLLICFSHLRWDFVFQRPQQLLTRAVVEYDVYFIEEPHHVADATPSLFITPDKYGVYVVVPLLPVGDDVATNAALRLLLDAFLERFDQTRTRVFWYYTPMALAFSGHQDASVVVYDNMDELSAFRGASSSMLENEKALLQQADIVFSGGASLYDAKRGRHAHVHLFPSSVDTAHFGSARLTKNAEPPDQTAIRGPRLGYFGVIDERIDLDLLDAVAVARPKWQFIMIGPVVKIDPASRPMRANIHWLGMKPYEELPSYMAGWNVGIMPFALNESTRYISPTKTPEFLAAGLPLVSTAIADVVHPYGTEGYVHIARSAEEFIDLCDAQLEGLDELALKRIDKMLSLGSWNKTWQQMSILLSKAAAGASRGRALQDRRANV